MFGNCVHITSARLFTLLNVKLFFDHILANLPWNATGIVRNLKTFKIWVFFEKADGFFLKKKTNKNLLTIANGSKFAVECVSNGIIS